jgi:hypothetical protein
LVKRLVFVNEVVYCIVSASKRKRSYGVRQTGGLETKMSEEGVVGCLVPRSKVGDL